MVNQVGVHRFIAGHQDHQRALTAAARAPGLLPEASNRTWEPGSDHGIQPADVDAQLQSRGGGHAEQGTIIQRLLQRAAVLGQIPRAVSRNPAREIRSAQPSGELFCCPQRRGFRRAPRAHKGQRPRALRHQRGHHPGRLRRGGAAHRGTILAFDAFHKARLPQRYRPRTRRRAILGHREHLAPRQPRGMPGGIPHGRRGRNNHRPRTIVFAQS